MTLPTSRPRITATIAAVLKVALLACVLLAAAFGAPARADDDPVLRWTQLADDYGHGSANWHTLAIMHRAMHDALNAAHPVYARWAPATEDEPRDAGAVPEAAMQAAAYQVLLKLHPDERAHTEEAFSAALAALPEGPGRQAGIRLGKAIGDAAVARRARDGWSATRTFTPSDQPGRWRPTPSFYLTSNTNDTTPFLFASRAEVPSVDPPALGSDLYARQRAETLRIGGSASTDRTVQQSESAFFWAYQSSQRGFVNLAMRLLRAHKQAGGVPAEARIMAQLTSALADSAILVWGEKEKYSFWRPVTAIRAEQPAPGAARWRPLVETPPFPEYPSGHAADCFTGAAVLAASFPDLNEPVVYIALHNGPAPQAAGFERQPPQATDWTSEHAPLSQTLPERTFPDFAAAAQDCALSRLWAGAHFRAADDEAKRLADLIAGRALASVPPLH